MLVLLVSHCRRTNRVEIEFSKKIPRQVAVEAVFQFNHNLAKLALALMSVSWLGILGGGKNRLVH